eukprot:CFRG3601T1
MSLKICKKKFLQVTQSLGIQTAVDVEADNEPIYSSTEEWRKEEEAGCVSSDEHENHSTNYRAVQRRWELLLQELPRNRQNVNIDQAERKLFFHEVDRCQPLIDAALAAKLAVTTATTHLKHGRRHFDRLTAAMKKAQANPALLSYNHLKENRKVLAEACSSLKHGKTAGDVEVLSIIKEIAAFVHVSGEAMRKYETEFPATVEAHKQKRAAASHRAAAPVRQLIAESNQLRRDLHLNSHHE